MSRRGLGGVADDRGESLLWSGQAYSYQTVMTNLSKSCVGLQGQNDNCRSLESSEKLVVPAGACV